MTVRAPGWDYLADVAIAYARTVAHGVAAGLTEDHARAAIGSRLGQDAEAGRTTDWALLCDNLTGLAEAVARNTRPKQDTPPENGNPGHGSGFTIADNYGGYPR